MYKLFIAFLLLLSFGVVKSFAQGYESDDAFNLMRKVPSYEEFKASKTEVEEPSSLPQVSSQKEEQKEVRTEEKEDVKAQNEPLKKIENQEVQNNNEAEIQSDNNENKKFAYVYYNNVEIINLANRVSCSVNFNVKNETDNTFSGLEMDLSWGNLVTNVKFSAIEPNSIATVPVRLLGKGCYNLKKGMIPQYKITLCRIRKMSAEECPSFVKWQDDK